MGRGAQLRFNPDASSEASQWCQSPMATATCHGLTLATRNSRDFSLSLGCVVHPYQV